MSMILKLEAETSKTCTMPLAAFFIVEHINDMPPLVIKVKEHNEKGPCWDI